MFPRMARRSSGYSPVVTRAPRKLAWLPMEPHVRLSLMVMYLPHTGLPFGAKTWYPKLNFLSSRSMNYKVRSTGTEGQYYQSTVWWCLLLLGVLCERLIIQRILCPHLEEGFFMVLNLYSPFNLVFYLYFLFTSIIWLSCWVETDFSIAMNPTISQLITQTFGNSARVFTSCCTDVICVTQLTMPSGITTCHIRESTKTSY